MGIHVNTELLACKHISEQAKAELDRAGCTIHKEVPGLDTDILIVELHFLDMKHVDGQADRSGYLVWDVPREIQIRSLGLYLSYQWSDEYNGYALRVWDEEETPAPAPIESTEDEDLSDLDEMPF